MGQPASNLVGKQQMGCCFGQQSRSHLGSHVLAPDLLGMDSPFLGGPLCNPQSEALVRSPTIRTDAQDAITRFLGYNHPLGSQIFYPPLNRQSGFDGNFSRLSYWLYCLQCRIGSQ